MAVKEQDKIGLLDARQMARVARSGKGQSMTKSFVILYTSFSWKVSNGFLNFLALVDMTIQDCIARERNLHWNSDAWEAGVLDPLFWHMLAAEDKNLL